MNEMFVLTAHVPLTNDQNSASRRYFLFQARMPSSVDEAKTIIVPPLKNICLTSYLAFLESACAGKILIQLRSLRSRFTAFIQLRMNPNPMFKRLTSSMLPALKNHLETTLSGACFSALRPALILIFGCKSCPLLSKYSSHREQMLEMVFSGKFPSALHKNTYAGL